MPHGIASAIKRLIIAIDTRTTIIERACPRMDEPRRARRMLSMVAEIQTTIDGIIKEIRNLTGERFKGFTDIELSMLCFIWASIWTEDMECHVDSQSATRIAGKNRPDEIEAFTAALTRETSPLLEFMTLKWVDDEKGLGHYRFRISEPQKLNAMILGTADEGRG